MLRRCTGQMQSTAPLRFRLGVCSCASVWRLVHACMEQELQDVYFASLWQEVVAFGGVFMIRRLVGIAHVLEMESIEVRLLGCLVQDFAAPITEC